MLLGGMLVGRRALFIPRTAGLLFGIAAAVRLAWIPISRHQYDGHEAEQLAWFLGERLPGAGDSLAYPLNQWWWWLWGVVLPADERLPLWISAVVGSAGVCAVAGVVGMLAGRRAAWMAGLMAALHPTHAAWSSSAYNVVLPHAFGALALLFVVVAHRRRAPVLLWSAVGAGALALAGRLDGGIVAVPCAMLALRWFSVRQWAAPAGIGALVGVGCVWDVLGAGPLPGAEERWSSLSNNMPILVYFSPVDSWVALAVLSVLAWGAWRQDRWTTVAMAVLVVGCHLLMSSFDDYGARHTLPALVGIAWFVGAGAARLHAVGGVGFLVMAVLCVQGMVDMRGRYYGEEERFTQRLAEEPWQDLPRITQRPGQGRSCGWIAEDPRVSADPPRSHFNLLQASEVASLRGDGGCLYWCVDVQDWRWSSRGVRNRALRLDRMYVLQPTAILMEQSSGYSCLVMDVGERRTLGWPTVAERNGRRHSADSFLP